MEYEIILPSGRVGVLVSGGADSALLLYLIASQNNHELVVLTICSDDKNHTLQAAIDVVQWVCENTDATILRHYIVNAPSIDKRVPMRKHAVSKLSEEYEIKSWLNGKTRNPDITLPYDDERKLDRDAPILHTVYDFQPLFFPLGTINKKGVGLLVEKYELGMLIALTVSCEKSNPPCKSCWWCEERKWAFGEY
jgi:7-cyano-7-deazaguanine synthase in queuosine biosynthesis